MNGLGFPLERSMELQDISIPSPFEDVLYRCEITPFEWGINTIQYEWFPITKRTRCGAWIEIGGVPKFVLLTAIKRWACETKKEALISFMKRKKKQVAILELQLDRAQRQYELAKKQIEMGA